MFHHIKGKLLEITPATAVVEASGLGYQVQISLNTYSDISNSKEVFLFLLPIFKEDSQTLFGFSEKGERELFSKLLSVSGVGGNTARVILSSLNVNEAINAIASENVGLLKSVKGIGAKTAQRIIIDLKDKVTGTQAYLGVMPVSSISSEAVAALEVLGYPPRLTERVVANFLKEEPHLKLEDLIKKALNKL